jgi:hypothetical protein
MLAAKGLRTLPKPLYRAWVGPTVCFTPALIPRSFPTRVLHGKLPHYVERFSPCTGIEVSWESTGGNA